MFCNILCSDILFSGSSDNKIKVWSIKLLQLQSTIPAHSDPVCTMACNEKYLFSGSLRSIKVGVIEASLICPVLVTNMLLILIVSI